MEPAVSAKLKDKHRDAWIASLTSLLYPGEELVALARVNLLRPMCDGLAVTNARIVAFQSIELSRKGFKVEAFADDLSIVEISQRRGSHYVVATRRGDGTEIVFGAVHKLDVDPVLAAAQRLPATGTPAVVQSAVQTRATASAADQDRWAQVDVVGDAPSEKAWRTIRDHATPNELPRFIISVGSGGVFAAFDDRCMIIKVGALTSMMAGTFGGGRISTFPYTDITGIEYNADMVSGVLEILTPSYQGTANKDYWRGTGKSRNADSNNPWTLSNTLPMNKPIYQQALPRLNELRAKITEAKRPYVIQAPAAPAQPGQSDMVEELTKLGGLHQQGLLTDAEFVAAKQAVLARHA